MSRTAASTLSLERVSFGKPPVAQIHDALRSAILSLEIAPGARVSEAEIARRVGASRTPVRAALARLGEEGLIETRPSRGNYVTRLSAEAVREAHFIRNALESTTVAALAREGLSEAMSTRLDTNLAAAEAAATRGERKRFARLDDEFHHLLAEATGHPRLVDVLEREKARLTRLRSLCPTEPSYMQGIANEHAGIVTAIRAGDETGARAASTEHIGRVLSMLEGLQRRHPDFFEEGS